MESYSSHYIQGRKNKYSYFILEVPEAIQLKLNASVPIFTFNISVESKYIVLTGFLKKNRVLLQRVHNFLVLTNST